MSTMSPKHRYVHAPGNIAASPARQKTAGPGTGLPRSGFRPLLGGRRCMAGPGGQWLQ